MVQNINPTFVKTPVCAVTTVSTGTSNAVAILYTGGANGSKINSVMVTANTTSTQDIRLAVQSSGGLLGYFNTVSVSTNSGFISGSATVNCLANAPLAIDSDGNPYLLLSSSAQALYVVLTTSSSLWSGGALMNFLVTAGDF